MRPHSFQSTGRRAPCLVYRTIAGQKDATRGTFLHSDHAVEFQHVIPHPDPGGEHSIAKPASSLVVEVLQMQEQLSPCPQSELAVVALVRLLLVMDFGHVTPQTVQCEGEEVTVWAGVHEHLVRVLVFRDPDDGTG